VWTAAPEHPAAYGLVCLLEEDTVDADSRSFRWVDLLEGGPQSGFSNPDNMAFLTPNELLVVAGNSTTSIGAPNFAFHGNNALVYVPLAGENANTAFRFATAPVEAELTGLQQRTLFLNVQHPGEETQRAGGIVGNPATYTSWWPDGNKTAGAGTPGKPKPSLVAIRSR
jgi:uncharacterized protein